MIDIEKWEKLGKFISQNWLSFIVGAVVGGGLVFGIYERIICPIGEAQKVTSQGESDITPRTKTTNITTSEAPAIGSASFGDNAIIANQVNQGMGAKDYTEALQDVFGVKEEPLTNKEKKVFSLFVENFDFNLGKQTTISGFPNSGPSHNGKQITYLYRNPDLTGSVVFMDISSELPMEDREYILDNNLKKITVNGIVSKTAMGNGLMATKVLTQVSGFKIKQKYTATN